MGESANQTNKSRRDTMVERLKGRSPDRDFTNDDDLFGQISADYDDYEGQIGEYKKREGQFADLFANDPRSAAFLMNWKDGGDPVTALVRQFGTDIKDAIDDPERAEEMAEANKAFLERVAKEKELEEEYQRNIKQSLSDIERVQQELGVSDDDVDRAMEWLMTIVKDGVMGKFGAESLKMAMNAVNHDADVAAASHEAEVRGKNTRAKEELRKARRGDGMPQLGGKSAGSGSDGKGSGSVFDLARMASE